MWDCYHTLGEKWWQKQSKKKDRKYPRTAASRERNSRQDLDSSVRAFSLFRGDQFWVPYSTSTPVRGVTHSLNISVEEQCTVAIRGLEESCNLSQVSIPGSQRAS